MWNRSKMGSTRRLESKKTKIPASTHHEKNVFLIPFLQVRAVNTEYLALNLPYTGCHIQGQHGLPTLVSWLPKWLSFFRNMCQRLMSKHLLPQWPSEPTTKQPCQLLAHKGICWDIYQEQCVHFLFLFCNSEQTAAKFLPAEWNGIISVSVPLCR